MNGIRKLKHELNYLKLSDIGAIFIFLAALIPSFLYCCWIKIKNHEIWLICEDPNEARDNGVCFFKYLIENTNIDAIYAINYSSKDFQKVRKIGKTVRYGSIRHWMIYFACKYNISSQKSGKPNAAIGYILEKLNLIKEKFIFLQHGITINKAEWLFYNNTRMKLFICGAKPEYEYVSQNFGYPSDHVKYLGFCRFDDYFQVNPFKNQILLIPTWREWIGSKNEFTNVYEDTSKFINTEYYQRYQSLINNRQLFDLLEKYNLIMYFYPHRNMQKFIDSFSTKNKRIRIVTNKDCSIRKLLIESGIMVTDYSSVALDFAYMKKPVIYYQFDVQRFREAQYAEGYFNYKDSGLGEVVNTESEVINILQKWYQNELKLSDSFNRAHEKFFPLWDNQNCSRIYKYLKDKSDE